MHVIPILSCKGGVGKTRICVGLGRALKGRNFKVGFLDIDWVAPNLHIELGISPDHSLILDSGVGDTIQPIISPENFPVVSSAFIFPHDQSVSMDEESTIKDIEEITRPGVINWDVDGPLDYLLMDTPPTTARFVQVALKIPNLSGVVLVTQPATTSVADLMRTISLIKDIHIPVLGLVGNQVYVECSHGEKINLYNLGEEDLEDLCHLEGIPYLGSIPHVVPKLGFPHFDGIVDSMLAAKPVFLKTRKVSTLPYKLILALARAGKHDEK